MESCKQLPGGYGEILSIDLHRDKKLNILISAVSLLVALLMLIIGHMVVPIQTFFDMSGGIGPCALRWAGLMAGLIAYIYLHERVHGIFMQRYSGAKVYYGHKGMFFYAGSDAYFCKRHYIIIALAPVVIWGIVLLCLCRVSPRAWFWALYIIQIVNFSGAAGDLYVVWRFSRLPGDILVRDSGVSMAVYSAAAQRKSGENAGGETDA